MLRRKITYKVVNQDSRFRGNDSLETFFAKYGDTFNTQIHGADYEINDISELIDIVKKENKI